MTNPSFGSPARPPHGSTISLRERFAGWLATGHSSIAWTVVVVTIVLVVLMPVCAVLVIALEASENAWPHLVSTVLPEALSNTLLLALGLGIVTLLVGTASAWLVTMYRFSGRWLVDRLLVVPLAMPTYIVAYCYAEVFDYAGPIQSGLRSMMGWQSVQDYWFPDIRSLPGAVLVIASVLYPYVYLTARASFVQQSVCVLEVARTLGRTPLGAFWSVALPMARPALAAGAVLVLMEGINDLGAVQHLGVQTLSASIYTTWLQRSNLGGAAQLAAAMLLCMAAILAIERLARGEARTHDTSTRHRSIPFQDLSGAKAYLAFAFCTLPFLAGFLLPLVVLVYNAVAHAQPAFAGGFVRAAANSLTLAACAALIAVTVGLILAYARRIAASRIIGPLMPLAGLGYAVPGTVLAIGLLIPLAALDNRIDALMRESFGLSTGLMLSGSLFALTLAYVIRFLAIALGGIDSGIRRISPNLDAAARTLGETSLSTLKRVHLPLLLPVLGSAGLLVFVDVMKELPATLILRPFDFETLATHVYGFAALEQFEAGALGALAIVIVGLLPVLLLHNTVASGRAGNHGSQ